MGCKTVKRQRSCERVMRRAWGLGIVAPIWKWYYLCARRKKVLQQTRKETNHEENIDDDRGRCGNAAGRMW